MECKEGRGVALLFMQLKKVDFISANFVKLPALKELFCWDILPSKFLKSFFYFPSSITICPGCCQHTTLIYPHGYVQSEMLDCREFHQIGLFYISASTQILVRNSFENHWPFTFHSLILFFIFHSLEHFYTERKGNVPINQW